jgi:hypothetical protein
MAKLLENGVDVQIDTGQAGIISHRQIHKTSAGRACRTSHTMAEECFTLAKYSSLHLIRRNSFIAL